MLFRIELLFISDNQLYSLNRSLFNCTIDMDSCLTTVPEESFYLFEIIITRAISQGNTRNICTIISIIKGLIEQYLHAFVLSLIRGRKTLPIPAGTVSLPKDQLAMVVILNDISVDLLLLGLFIGVY